MTKASCKGLVKSEQMDVFRSINRDDSSQALGKSRRRLFIGQVKGSKPNLK